MIQALIDAGLQSIPGGGAEILVDEVRLETLAYPKASTEGWLDVMRTGHELGLRTTATMMPIAGPCTFDETSGLEERERATLRVSSSGGA